MNCVNCHYLIEGPSSHCFKCQTMNDKENTDPSTSTTTIVPSSIIPFFDENGVFLVERVPTTDAIVSSNDVHGGKPNPNSYEMKYGFLCVFQLLGIILKIPTPHLNSLLTPFGFQKSIDEIIAFYAVADHGPTIGSDEAFNYLRLHAIGGQKGDIPAWKSGLFSGQFLSADGTVIGEMVPICEDAVKNLSKSDKGFWKRPYFMFPLNREFEQIRRELAQRNEALLETCDYAGQATLVLNLIQTIQIFCALELTKYMVTGCGLYVLDISAKGIIYSGNQGILVRDKNDVKILHDCISFVHPGWLQKVKVPSTRGVCKFFKAAENKG